jgi:8-oxo-dGTP pyrophosphatase MutT (NUDIX family)
MTYSGIYPSTVYRVSLKAVIRNDKGEVLLVKENGSGWSLPGGGLDHGESDIEALRRELWEEVAYKGEFEAAPIYTASFFVEEEDRWFFWVVYNVKTQNNEFSVGVDADEIAFIDPCTFKGSLARSEQLVYKTCVDHDAPFDYGPN